MRIILCILVLFLASIVAGQDIPKKPDPARYINDFTGTFLTKEESSTLEKKMIGFFDSTKAQIAVVIVNDLGGYDKAQYATEIGNTWGVGQKGKDNGVVVLIKARKDPKDESEKRSIFIAPGYGLEGVIPDITCRHIEDDEMVDLIKENKNFKAIDQGTSVIMSLIKKEFPADKYNEKKDFDKKLKWVLILIGVVIFISALLGFIHWSVSGIIGGIATPLIWVGLLSGGLTTILLCILVGAVASLILHFIFRAGTGGSGGDGIGGDAVGEILGGIGKVAVVFLGGAFGGGGGGVDF